MSNEYFVKSPWGWKVYLLGLLALFVAGIAVCIGLAHGPDRTLTFDREAHSEIAPDLLARKLDDPQLWKKWFFSLDDAEIVHGQALTTGAELLLHINPKKGKSRRFDISARVREYIPGRKLALDVTDDSKGRLTNLFDRLSWTVELTPEKQGTLIHGQATAHTIHWRSRLFGRISERILMNQVFYPDLLELGGLMPPPEDP